MDMERWRRKIKQHRGGAGSFLPFDIDVLDPSAAPPEPVLLVIGGPSAQV